MIDSARQIGRHFAVVSVVPALVVTLFALLLMAAGAPGSEPSLDALAGSLDGLGLFDVGLLLVLALAVGLVLQPFNFSATQLFEGYWGPSDRAQRGMLRGARAHLERFLELEGAAAAGSLEVEECEQELELLHVLATAYSLSQARSGDSDDAGEELRHEREAILDRLVGARLQRDAALRGLLSLPDDPGDLMPTRLGNMLRAYERRAGAAYGLDAVTVTGLLVHVVDEPLRDYHDDARTTLDLAVNTIVMWIAFTLVGFLFLWNHGLWLLVPAGSSILAAVAYRGAVSSAMAYGEALEVLITLGRFELYDRMRLPQPQSAQGEILSNRELMAQIRGEPQQMRYRSK